MCVYLLHFSRPISDRHTCQHYLGWTPDLEARIVAHLAGRGARLTQVALSRGISFVVARIWPDGDRAPERRLKNRKEAPRLCPLCYPVRLGECAAQQLALPLFDPEDFPTPPTLPIDWYEISHLRHWRMARVPAVTGGLSDDLL